jgi:deazaflavin-dependent oxidoreductase (nitroreductase family)
MVSTGIYLMASQEQFVSKSMEQSLPYPSGLVRNLYRLPIYLHRLGLGDLVGLAHIMILTTRGRNSGVARFTPLEFRRHGSKIYIVSAWGARPNWYKNLLADSNATVQIGRTVHRVRAQVVDSPAEAMRVLYMFRRTAPFLYDRLLTRLSSAESIDLNTLVEVANQFKIMRLEVVPQAPILPTVPPDRRWIWGIVGSLVIFAFLLRLGRSRK